jgi:hypothetical protein
MTWRQTAVAVCVSCAVVGAAVPAALGDPKPKGPKVHGEGYLSPFIKDEFQNKFKFDVEVKLDPNKPPELKGQITIDGRDRPEDKTVKHRFSAEPICLNVVGNMATFVFRFSKKVEGEPDAFVGGQFWVQDNGKAKGDDPPTDTTVNNTLNEDQLEAADCNNVVPQRPPKPIAKGDIEVTPATP